MDVSLWGYIKEEVYVPPLRNSLQGLKDRINQAVESVDTDILHKAWD
jgi:hypothetical protein